MTNILIGNNFCKGLLTTECFRVNEILFLLISHPVNSTPIAQIDLIFSLSLLYFAILAFTNSIEISTVSLTQALVLLSPMSKALGA